MIFVGNSSLDSYVGGTAASWFWTSCQSVVGGIQDAFEGIPMLNSSTNFLTEKRFFLSNYSVTFRRLIKTMIAIYMIIYNWYVWDLSTMQVVDRFLHV